MNIDNIQLMAIILQVLGVDGNLSEDEIDAVEKEAVLLQIDDKKFKKVISYIDKIKDPGEILKGIDSYEGKIFTMQEIYKVLYSKNRISRLERNAADWIRKSLGLSDSIAKRLEAIVKKMKRLSDELDSIYNQCSS